jgi:hypothetical protein
MKITITAGRGKPYVALIAGLHPKYKFDRKFLTLRSAGNKMNCYEDFRTVEDVAEGQIVEIKTHNYRGGGGGVEDRGFAQMQADGSLKKLSEADVYDALEKATAAA